VLHSLGLCGFALLRLRAGACDAKRISNRGAKKGSGRAGKQNKTKQGEPNGAQVTSQQHHSTISTSCSGGPYGLCCQSHWRAVWLSGNRTLLFALLQVTSHRDNTESGMACGYDLLFFTHGPTHASQIRREEKRREAHSVCPPSPRVSVGIEKLLPP